MNKQYEHPDRIPPHHSLCATDQCTSTKAEQQVPYVVCMPRPPPESAAQQQTRMLSAVRGSEARDDALGGLAPDHAVAASSSDGVFLMVYHAEHYVACYSEGEEEGEVRR